MMIIIDDDDDDGAGAGAGGGGGGGGTVGGNDLESKALEVVPQQHSAFCWASPTVWVELQVHDLTQEAATEPMKTLKASYKINFKGPSCARPCPTANSFRPPSFGVIEFVWDF